MKKHIDITLTAGGNATVVLKTFPISFGGGVVVAERLRNIFVMESYQRRTGLTVT